MPTYETPEPISVTIHLGLGDVHIIAGDRSDTVVDVLPSDDTRTGDLKAAERTRVEYSNGKLLITAPKQLFGRSGSIDVAIELPSGSDVDGEAGMGEFRGEGQLGDCKLNTGMGDIRLDHTAALYLKSGYGTVNVDRAVGDVLVTTGSGEVRVGEIDGTGVIKNSNGATKVGAVTGDLRVNSANGDISVDRAHASVTAKTANGNIRVGEVESGSVVLETAVGELEVGVHEGTAVWLDASSLYGGVQNSLDASGGPGESDKTVEVRARTSYGAIVIHRSKKTPNEMKKGKT